MTETFSEFDRNPQIKEKTPHLVRMNKNKFTPGEIIVKSE